jgi:hypothetical protein
VSRYLKRDCTIGYWEKKKKKEEEEEEEEEEGKETMWR